MSQEIVMPRDVLFDVGRRVVLDERTLSAHSAQRVTVSCGDSLDGAGA